MVLSKHDLSSAHRAVASLNTPLFDANPAVLQKLKDLGIFDYQVYFQKPVSL